MRHRHLDFDIGEADLNSLAASGTVPTSTAILSTSLGKYPILWRVVGFTFTHQERTLKLRTIVLGSYLDCTSCNRVLRLQGFASIYRRTLLRFHSESRWPSVGYSSDERHAFVSRNHIAKVSR
jgi:hypothetical protein